MPSDQLIFPDDALSLSLPLNKYAGMVSYGRMGELVCHFQALACFERVAINNFVSRPSRLEAGPGAVMCWLGFSFHVFDFAFMSVLSARVESVMVFMLNCSCHAQGMDSHVHACYAIRIHELQNCLHVFL
eukprot:jgi/Botrbrau1/5268/Bobra.0172s0127.1